ncbi:PH domain-containing protein [Blastococcus montanus]|uniref:PH domain-containing protein n=1 Tax=Blastococcus montanus TaxID=3144973 RepID=UPI003208C71F
MSAPSPPVRTVSAVPRRMRQMLAVGAAVVVAVAVVVALSLPSTPNTVVNYGLADQIAIGALGLLLGAGVLLLGRSRVDADAAGVHVRNFVVHHAVPWTAVRAVRFERSSAWASLLLENGDEISMHGLQALDKEQAVQAVEGMRALHAAARANDPVRPPLLYDD